MQLEKILFTELIEYNVHNQRFSDSGHPRLANLQCIINHGW